MSAQPQNLQKSTPVISIIPEGFCLDTYTCHPSHHRTTLAIHLAKKAHSVAHMYQDMMDYWNSVVRNAPTATERLDARFEAEEYGRKAEERQQACRIWIEKALFYEAEYQ